MINHIDHLAASAIYRYYRVLQPYFAGPQQHVAAYHPSTLCTNMQLILSAYASHVFGLAMTLQPNQPFSSPATHCTTSTSTNY